MALGFLSRLRFALRSVLREPGHAIAFVLTLGLGIGANSAIFSVVNGVLLRPLPYPDAERIVYLEQPAEGRGLENISFSFDEIADYREQSRTVEEFVEFGDWTFNVLGRGDPHRANGGLVTANFFEVLGMRPQLGRLLLPEDRSPGAPPVAVLTHDYWVRVTGADPNAVGQTLDLTAKTATIVGVLAPGAHYATQRGQDFYV
ncbi:MAG: multidrug ABC transporter substrate-binding protein, partial [Gemmatimonadetes bacterium]|nr:multidrug ABC transporter substrate-binding protein [Gemmatimonadota bacterium]